MSHAQGHGHGHLVPPLPRRGAGKLTSAASQFAQLAKGVMVMNGSEWQPILAPEISVIFRHEHPWSSGYDVSPTR